MTRNGCIRAGTTHALHGSLLHQETPPTTPAPARTLPIPATPFGTHLTCPAPTRARVVSTTPCLPPRAARHPLDPSAFSAPTPRGFLAASCRGRAAAASPHHPTPHPPSRVFPTPNSPLPRHSSCVSPQPLRALRHRAKTARPLPARAHAPRAPPAQNQPCTSSSAVSRSQPTPPSLSANESPPTVAPRDPCAPLRRNASSSLASLLPTLTLPLLLHAAAFSFGGHPPRPAALQTGQTCSPADLHP